MLYRITDLSTVWVYLDIYEADLAWIRYGQAVDVTAEAYPGRIFKGTVTFIEPTLDERTRTVRVPVLVKNEGGRLRPNMYVSAVIMAALGPDGEAGPTGAEGRFTCSMHPHVLEEKAGPCPMCGMPMKQIPGDNATGQGSGKASEQSHSDRYACPMKCEGEKTYDRPGNCPVCGMKLDKVRVPAKGRKELLAVPASAVLDSGTRKIVYVEKGGGVFEGREVVLGPRCDEWFPVLNGLSAGERVVKRGGFLVDSQFQITGLPSLYYPGGLRAGSENAGTGGVAGRASAANGATPSEGKTSNESGRGERAKESP